MDINLEDFKMEFPQQRPSTTFIQGPTKRINKQPINLENFKIERPRNSTSNTRMSPWMSPKKRKADISKALVEEEQAYENDERDYRWSIPQDLLKDINEELNPTKKIKKSKEKELERTLESLNRMKLTELKTKAEEMGLNKYKRMKKSELVNLIKNSTISKSQLKIPLEPQPVIETKSKIVAEPKTKSRTSSSKIKINKIIGKYELVKELGSGVYGTTYKALNTNRAKGEDKFYAVKLIKLDADPKRAIKSWEREVRCLQEVYDICNEVGILCYKESFVEGDNYVIVTSLLDRYVTLHDYLFGSKTKSKRNYSLTLEMVEQIYSDVIDVKNALTQLCINHSDLHTSNIMIQPITRDLKVIDFGLCKTPEQEEKMYANDPDKRNIYTDLARLKRLREYLYLALNNMKKDELDQNDPNLLDFTEKLNNKYPIEQYKKGCKRPSAK
jgi:tRNA A-37 threonylcarbamoyl transferase component Bud32